MNTHLNLVETTKAFYTGRVFRELHYLRISAVAVPATLLGAVDQQPSHLEPAGGYPLATPQDPDPHTNCLGVGLRTQLPGGPCRFSLL